MGVCLGSSSQKVRLLEQNVALLVTLLKAGLGRALPAVLFMGPPYCPFHLFTAFLWSNHSRSLKVVLCN